MIFAVIMNILTSKTPENPEKFAVWHPKPMTYKGELVEKWSVTFTKSKKFAPGINVRKKGWYVSNYPNSYMITENGLIKNLSDIGSGLDDLNSERSIEHDFRSLIYNESVFSSKYVIKGCEDFITDNEYLYCYEDIEHTLRKIDINTGKIIWTYVEKSDFPHVKPPMYVLKNKIVLNTYVWGKDKEGNPDTPDTVTLVDINTGKGQVLDIQGSVIGTVYNNELYLIIDEVKVSKYDIENNCLTGKMFDIREHYINGEYYWSYSNYWFTFSSDGINPNLLLNPNTMELCKLDANYCISSDLLYDKYFLCWMKHGDRIIGIDTKTFEETWSIPVDKLGKSASVFMGDQRGILVQDQDKLICFGPP
jgi:hypothetical protein